MRYIVISVPPEPMAREIHRLQKTLSGRTGAREALRYPPHVTLRTGLVCPETAAGDAVHAFLEHARALKGAEIVCTGPAASAYRDASGIERGFLGYKVTLSDDLLRLHRGLLAFSPWMKGPQGSYEPHVSLCYHDVSPAEVRVLLKEFRQELEEQRPSWRADTVELWEQTGDTWRLCARVALCQAAIPANNSAIDAGFRS
jgi:2'-5' RNA ligase